MNLAHRAALPVLLAIWCGGCAVGGGPMPGATASNRIVRGPFDPGRRNVLHVGLLEGQGGAVTTLSDRRHLVVGLPEDGCGQPRIAPAREGHTGGAEPLRLRLCLAPVACPGSAVRHVGG